MICVARTNHNKRAGPNLWIKYPLHAMHGISTTAPMTTANEIKGALPDSQRVTGKDWCKPVRTASNFKISYPSYFDFLLNQLDLFAPFCFRTENQAST